MEELRGIAFDLSPDFICVTETWTNSDHTDSYLSIKAYNIICRHDRKDTNAGTGGGLLIYAKDSLCVPESFQPVYKMFNQCCGIKIPLRDRTMEMCPGGGTRFTFSPGKKSRDPP